MQIAAKKIVTIQYTLKDDKGEVLDTSEGGVPLVYLHGTGTLVSGLEKALDGKGPGDAVQVTVPPEEGYGKRDPALIQRMPIRKLPGKKAEVGNRFRVQTPEGIRILTVTAIQGDYATVDPNHPLADLTLHFDVKVVEVRDATDEEMAHGHVHGAGGHNH